jgi:protocatechuate 3,4-dioxygenase beta subunit
MAQTMPPIFMKDHVKFVSQPPLTGQAGIVYSYTAKAVSSDTTATIHYFPLSPMAISVQPNKSITVDSVTGVVTFTPKVKGWYTLEIVARSSKGGSATQLFVVTVTGGNYIVQGKVTDTLGINGIKNVIITLFKTDTISTVQPMGSVDNDFQGNGGFAFWTITDASGNYRITGVDPGNYKVQAISPTKLYLSQWYDGQTNVASANIVQVKDSSSPTLVNIKLRGIASIKKYPVSGSVEDTLNAALKNADVFIVPIDFALSTNNTVDDYQKYFDINANVLDCRLDGNSPRVVHVKTDSLGNYKVSIAAGTYIAFAKAQGYMTEYYQDQSSLLLATPITVQDTTPNINFTLAPLPKVALGVITGSVLDSSKDVGIPARIIATRADWITFDWFKRIRSYVVDTDSLGNYTLNGLPSGSYFVFALPLGSYAPAYYTNDTASTHWKNASKVVITNGSTENDINIYVHQFPVSVSGYAGISGKISTKGSASTGIPGAVVYASKNNQIAGYSITGSTGAYTIDGLAPGSYSVSVDNLGSEETSPLSASLSYSNTGAPNNANANFSIIQTVTGVEQPAAGSLPTSFGLAQNYPNPFNPSTTIRYTVASSGPVSLKVYNLLGQEITTLANGYQTAGTYQVEFNGKGLASGIYFYRLHSQSTDIARKMILLQ